MNPATALATALVDELARCGVTDAVLAPGSRSAPLALALHDEPRIRLHVRIDERSASFLALGLAKVSRRPAAVVCTSGTAAANFHPAVVEADQSGVPLLVLTADRPPELRDTGANQTIDQIKLYGSAVRWFCEVGVPEARSGLVAYWRSLACRAYARALGPEAGPVHLNLAFREPLLPDEDDAWPEPLEGRPGGEPWTRIDTDGPAVPPGELPDLERGLLVAGDTDDDPGRYVALAERRGWPVLAEPTSNARYGRLAISAYHYLLGVTDFVDAHQPEIVVAVGKPGLSRPLLALLRSVPEHIVISRTTRFADPARSVGAVGGPGERGGGAPRVSAWSRSWLSAEQRARNALDAVIDETGKPTEPGVARDLADTLPDGALLFAGSSMPIRDLNLAMRPRTGLRVIGNRGASGIDGTVSAAMGAALAHDGPAYALIGDLALLHDLGGLLLGPDEPRPDLTIVVINNDGGGIFSLLPQAELHESFERVFGTPHGIDLAGVCASIGVPHTVVESLAELPRALRGNGLRVVEVRTDRTENAARHERLQEAVTCAVREAVPHPKGRRDGSS